MTLWDAPQKVFIVFNPKSGKEERAAEIRSMLARYFAPPHWKPELYETTGKEDLGAICRAACKRGTSLVIAAGGDGTVCGVANGLIQSRVPLGILPLGTGNGLARVLGIPLNLAQALEVLSGEHLIIGADALRVGERYFFLNVSAGISPQMMSETKPEQKKRFGRLAYVWTMIKRASIFQLRRYQLTIDDRTQWVNASEILISNTTLLDKPPHVFGPSETLNDGQLEVYLVTAHRLSDYLRLFWAVFSRPGQPAAKLHHLQAQRCVSIKSAGHPRLIQADGEVIGQTPVEVELIPTAIHLIKPNPAPA